MSTILAAILIGAFSISTANAAAPNVAIERGIRAGLLTQSEIHTLNRELARIAGYERSARRDGRVTKGEQRRLNELRRAYDKRLSAYLRNGRRVRR
jgi:hypothetical protein